MRKVESYVLGVVAVIVLYFVFAFQAFADQSIILRSGNGPVGSQDAQVHFLAYGRLGDVTPAASDFISVQTDKYAYIDAPYPTYIQSLPTDPLAHWISTTPNLGAGSALYAIPFTVTDPVIGSASLDLGYSVDNAINGIYINGTLISGNSHDGDYHGEYYELRSDIAPLLKPNAVNWLYINASDYGGYAGIIFNATIMVQGGSAATPSVSPNQGGNTGQVTVRIIGSGFQPAQPDSTGSQIKLTGIGPDIPGFNTTVSSPNVLIATLNLTGAALGLRSVVVTNPDGTSTTISNAFTILSGSSAAIQVQKIGTPAVDGRNETFFVTATNPGNVDSGAVPITELMEPWFTFEGSTPALTSSQPAGWPWGQDYNGFLNWSLPPIPAHGSSTISYTVKLDPKVPAESAVQGPACTKLQNQALDLACSTGFGLCVTQVVPKACQLGGLLGGPWGLGLGCVTSTVFCVGAWLQCQQDVNEQCASATSDVKTSVDPNDITGPPGGGTQGWFQDNQPLQYTLSYNNLATATNPATDVYLTDTFDPSTMDLNSLTIGAISVPGGQYLPPSIPLAGNPFTHDIDLRPGVQLLVRVSAALDLATNQVNISLHTLDPNTGLTPADPTIGFLQPGASGSVLFTLNSKPGLSTGTAVKDNASVIFDSNAAIKAPQWLNTVDTIAPVSHVVALPATETTTSFSVSWTGTDVGSGIANYSIYVSDNGGPFQYWLLNTLATSGTYQGVLGHTYAFYSIAEDGAGNTEAAKTVAETSTEVVAPPANQCTINYSNGFTGSTLTLNGGAAISGSALELTDGGSYEARSAFFPTPVPIGNFVTDFTFQLTNAQADGFAFVVQTNSSKAVGGGEGGLGYAGIPNSAALKFDLFSNYGEGPSSTGFFLNGAFPAIPSVDLLSKGIDLHSGHIFAAHIVYDGSLVTAAITDTVTNASYTVTDKIPAMSAPGGRAYLGFTGGTGRLSATQNILTWSYSSTEACSSIIAE